jgi:outer membrane lipoprotein-sorting protein
MKVSTIFKNVLLIGFVSTAMIFTSCKKEEKVVKANEGATKVSIPCQSEGRSDAEYFRADASAASQDQNLSREKSLGAAKQRLSGLIETKLKSVTDRYVNETEFGEDSQYESKFENLTREVVSQKLLDVAVICEETFKETSGKFTTYTAIEVSKDVMLNGISNTLSKDQKLRVDYDKQKFEQIFNEEMSKMEEAGN